MSSHSLDHQWVVCLLTCHNRPNHPRNSPRAAHPGLPLLRRILCKEPPSRQGRMGCPLRHRRRRADHRERGVPQASPRRTESHVSQQVSLIANSPIRIYEGELLFLESWSEYARLTLIRFSRRSILDFIHIIYRHIDTFSIRMQEFEARKEPMNLTHAFPALTGDIIMDYFFGFNYAQLKHPEFESFHDAFQKIGGAGHVATQFPLMIPVRLSKFTKSCLRLTLVDDELHPRRCDRMAATCREEHSEV